jgi:hypothetical protein
MSAQHQSTEKHPLSSGMDHALDSETQGPVKQLRRPGDNGPAMQSAANASAQVKQLKASESAANTAVIQRKQSNETGLPDELKSGIESLSGMSMDHVKVVYNSSKPAEVNALAYAEGSVIHVAPGQEQHLPEEAWHVVQQMQGKVRETTKVAGVAVNNDPDLEHEAEEKGAEALKIGQPGAVPTALASSAAPQGGPIQRKVIPYTTSANKEEIDYYSEAASSVADEVNRLTKKAREYALDWPNYLESGNAKLKLWAKTAQEYFDNPKQSPDFIHARFGYAIEEIVNLTLARNINGLTVDLQVTAGNTRPDIVLFDGKKQVAWLDITAEESEGHILDKQGAGWSTRPYVAEILYKSLQLTEVLAVSQNDLFKALGGYHADKNDIKHDAETQELENLRKQLINFRDTKGFGTKIVSAGTKKEMTKEFLNSLGMNLPERSCNVDAKGAVALAEFSPTQFGMQDGKQDIQHARKFIAYKAQDEIKQNMKSYILEQAEETYSDLQGFEDCDLKKVISSKLFFAIKDSNVSENLILVALAARECLALSVTAHEASLDANFQHGGDEGIQEVTQDIHHHRIYLPSDLDLNTLMQWYKEMQKKLAQLKNAVKEAENLDDDNLKDEDLEGETQDGMVLNDDLDDDRIDESL